VGKLNATFRRLINIRFIMDLRGARFAGTEPRLFETRDFSQKQ
jgi:hypothetical protein